MKIIGFTTDGAILQAGGEEVAHLMGHDDVYNVGKSGWGTIREKVSVGTEFEINAQWKWLRKAQQAYGKIKESAGLLRAAADILDQAPPEALREPEKQST